MTKESSLEARSEGLESKEIWRRKSEMVLGGEREGIGDEIERTQMGIWDEGSEIGEKEKKGMKEHGKEKD